MKKFIKSLVIILCLVGVTSNAQKKIEHRLEKLKTELQLSNQQTEDFKAAMFEKRARMKVLKAEREQADEYFDEDEFRARKKEVTQAFKNKIKTILSTDQWIQYQEINSEHKKRKKKKREEKL